MDLRRDSLCHLVILQGQADLLLVSRVQQRHVEVELLSVEHVKL